MGAPGYTIFCKNGHIAQSVMHHEIALHDATKCPICGVHTLTTQMEWGDEDYAPHEVPYSPIRHDWIERNNDTFKGQQKIAIYDISKVEHWREHTPDEALYCVDCGNMFILESGEIDFYNRKGLSKPRRCKGCRADRKNPEKAKKEYERLKKKFE